MDREPIEGVAFLLNDVVQVIAGPHSGAGGSVISLLALQPEPVYLVELGDGHDVELRQSEVIGAGALGALAELQRWYSAQCDGDWEHTYGIEIGTLDNPGWSVRIDLVDTPLEAAAFTEVRQLEPDREWIHCRVQDGRFEGHGGPHMLGPIIQTFLKWADAISRHSV